MLNEALPRQNGGQPLSPEALEFMADGLAEIPMAALAQAGCKARDTLRWFPTVAELREMAGYRQPKPDEIAQAEALAAWETCRRWCCRNARHNVHTGVYEMPDAGRAKGGPLDPRIEHALRLAGGINRVLCSRDRDDEQWCRKAFVEAYRLAPEIERTVALLDAGAAALVAGTANKLALAWRAQ